MNKVLVAIGGLGVGAGLMYLADPDHGRRRRARVRDMAVHCSRTAVAIAESTSRDVQHRLTGVAARSVGRLIVPDVTPEDHVLVARVRARVGRLVSHPHAIEVHATSGKVTVGGPVFESEVAALLSGVAGVAGVTDVENQLKPYARAEQVPALQGPGPRESHRLPEILRHWTPTSRLLATVAGLVLVAVSTPARGARRTASGVIGVHLLEHAVGRRA